MQSNPLRLTTWALCLSTVLLPPGCRDDAPAGDGADTEGSSTGTGDDTGSGTEASADETATEGTEAVTFWQDVAPVLYDSCVSCHREGGIGPFPLETFADAQPWAVAVAAALEARTMPPWLVTDDGSCGDFRHSRWLPEPDIELVRQWVDGGTLEGTPRDDLTLPEPPGIDSPTILATPDFVPEIQGGELAEFDEYRCFRIDPALPADRFLTAYDVRPGNASIVHHVLVMPVDPTLVTEDGRTNDEVMQALDDESPTRDGWSCFGEAGDGVETSGIPKLDSHQPEE